MSVFRTLLMICCIAATAFAQADADRPAAKISVTYEIGFDGILVADAYNPIVVRLAGSETSESGVIIVECGTGQEVITRVLAPFTTTPGLVSRVEVSSPIPLAPEYTWNDKRFVQITVRTDEVLDRSRYSVQPSDIALKLRVPPVSRESVVILNVGGSSAEILTQIQSTSFSPSGDMLINVPSVEQEGTPNVVLQMRGLTLPGRPVSYQGIDMIVLAGDAVHGLEPAAADALRDWLARGGRLVLVPESAATVFDMWGIAGELGWDRDGRGKDTLRVASHAEPLWHDVTFTITSKTEEDDAERSTDHTVLTRRIGFGQITVVPHDPKTGGVHPNAIATYWERVIDASDPPARQHDVEGRYGFDFSWYESTLNYMALDRATTLIGNTEPFPFWIFAVLVGVMGVLIGPVDFFVLKRLRKRQYAWATTLAWVTIAGVLASYIPGVIRSNVAQVGRFTVLDTIEGEGVALRTGHTTIFSAAPMTADIIDDDPDASWRVIPSQRGIDGSGFMISSPPTIAQPVSPLPTNVRLPTWSIRTFTDEGIVPSPYSASVEDAGDGQVRVTIDGLDPASVLDVYVVIDGIRSLARIDRGANVPNRTTIIGPEGRMESPNIISSFGGWNTGVDEASSTPSFPFVLGSLLGEAHRRTAVLEGDTRRGSVLVGVMFDASRADAGLNDPDAVSSQRTLLRILIPETTGESP